MKKLVSLCPADIEYIKKQPGTTFSKKLKNIIETYKKIKIFGRI